MEPALALRSAPSILRATRKVYVQHAESTLFATRVLFTPTIPAAASPAFCTSGVSNAWALRFEFVTSAAAMRGGYADDADDLLEQTYADDRGEMYEPREAVAVESFDACIPVRVYPNGSDPGAAVGAGAGEVAWTV